MELGMLPGVLVLDLYYEVHEELDKSLLPSSRIPVDIASYRGYF